MVRKDENGLLDQLYAALEKDKFNHRIATKIALYYHENPRIENDKEEEKHFMLARYWSLSYREAHNYAYYLYCNSGPGKYCLWSDLIKQPRNYRPYFLNGLVYYDEPDYREAVRNFEKAASYSQRSDIFHNIGCCYFMLREYDQAETFFKQSISVGDAKGFSRYMMGLIHYLKGDYAKIPGIAEEIIKCIDENPLKRLDALQSYHIAYLYFIIEDYANVSRFYSNGAIDIGVVHPPVGIVYGLYQHDWKLWQELMKKYQEETFEFKMVLIEHIKNSTPFTDDDQLEIREIEEEIELDKLKNKQVILSGVQKPEIDVHEMVIRDRGGCLYFGCKVH
jgi:tetratricopeptide (TPR) repeat protein